MRQKKGVIPLFVAYGGRCRMQRDRNNGNHIRVLKSHSIFAVSKGTKKDSRDSNKITKQ